jgi:hypothetical protein
MFDVLFPMLISSSAKPQDDHRQFPKTCYKINRVIGYVLPDIANGACKLDTGVKAEVF